MVTVIFYSVVPQLTFDAPSYQVAESVGDEHLALYVCVSLVVPIETSFTASLNTSSITAIGVCILYICLQQRIIVL